MLFRISSLWFCFTSAVCNCLARSLLSFLGLNRPRGSEVVHVHVKTHTHTCVPTCRRPDPCQSNHQETFVRHSLQAANFCRASRWWEEWTPADPQTPAALQPPLHCARVMPVQARRPWGRTTACSRVQTTGPALRVHPCGRPQASWLSLRLPGEQQHWRETGPVAQGGGGMAKDLPHLSKATGPSC